MSVELERIENFKLGQRIHYRLDPPIGYAGKTLESANDIQVFCTIRKRYDPRDKVAEYTETDAEISFVDVDGKIMICVEIDTYQGGFEALTDYHFDIWLLDPVTGREPLDEFYLCLQRAPTEVMEKAP